MDALNKTPLSPARKLAFEQAINTNFRTFGVRTTYVDLHKDLNMYDKMTQGVIITCIHDAAVTVGLRPVFDPVCQCRSCDYRKVLNMRIQRWAEDVYHATEMAKRFASTMA
ncbi:hypothetical protein CspHIS471_0303400 [Cutaneotrichosporon sp. HIS471]|nr:hypothetical protein CspHIS471_0303400 [Cutaneotrichosporon sp. HIS471]